MTVSVRIVLSLAVAKPKFTSIHPRICGYTVRGGDDGCGAGATSVVLGASGFDACGTDKSIGCSSGRLILTNLFCTQPTRRPNCGSWNSTSTHSPSSCSTFNNVPTAA